jgi:hypothetical protein
LTGKDRSILKKIMKYSAYTALGILILIAGSIALTLFLVNTGWGKDRIVGIANDNSPVQIKLGDLSMNVLKGRVELRDLSVYDSEDVKMGSIGYFGVGVQYKPMFSKRYVVDSLIIENINIDVSAMQLEAFKNDKPVEEKSETDTTKAELDLIVKKFEIRGISAKYKDGVSGSEYALRNKKIKASADVKNMKFSLLLEGTEADVKTPQLHKTVKNDSLDLRLEGDKAFIGETEFVTQGLVLSLGGSVLNLFDIPFFDVKFKADIETEKLLDRMEAFAKDSGMIRIAGSVKGEAEDPEADFTVRHGGGVVYAQKITGLDLTVGFKKKILELGVNISKSATEKFAIDGTVDLTGVFPEGLLSSGPALDKIEYDLVVSAENFSLSNIAGMPDAVFDFGLDLKGRGIEPDKITASVLLNTDISPFSFDKFSLKEEASLFADINWDKGKFTAATDISAGSLSWDQYEINSFVLSAGANDKGIVEISKFEIKIDSSTVSLSGNAKVFGKDFKPLKNPEIDFEFTGANLRSEKFYPEIATEINFSGWVKGFADAPLGSIQANAGSISYQGVEIDSISLKAGIDKKKIGLEKLDVLAGGGTISAKGTLTDFKRFSTVINIENVKADSIYPSFAGQMNAVLGMSLKAEGTFDDPSAEGKIVLSDILAGDMAVPDTKIDILFKDMKADVTVDPGFIIKAHSDLKTKDYSFGINFEKWDFSSFLPANEDGHIKGLITGKILGKGNLDRIDQYDIETPIDSLTIDMDGRRYISGYGLNTKVKNKKISLEGFKLNLLDKGFIDISGYADLENGLDIKAEIVLPVLSLSFLSDDLIGSEGYLKGEINVAGTVEQPVISGKLYPENIGMNIELTEQKLHSVNGEILISKDKIAVTSLQGMLDKGSFCLKGDVSLKENKPDNIEIEFNAIALPINYPGQLEGLLNSSLGYAGSMKKGKLEGEIEIVEALYYKDFDLYGGMFKGSGGKVVKSTSPNDSLPDISLDIALKSRRNMVMDNNAGFLELKPDLQIKGDITTPLISGRAVIRKDGFIVFQKKTFTISKGVLDFEPVYGMLPSADVEAHTEVGNHKIFLSVTENLANPKFTLTSQPSESDADILSILIFGRKTSELSGGGEPVSKEKMIADWLSSTYSQDVAKKTGLDYIDVSVPDNFSSSAPAGYGLTVGKKIADRLILKYSLVNDGSVMIQKGIADYQMFENIIFSGFQSTDGNFGAETQYRLEFR